MSKHTKVPWIAVGAWVEVEESDIADICSCNPKSIGQEHLTRSYEEQCANARLIAAAPGLYDFIERISRMSLDDGITSQFSDKESLALLIENAKEIVEGLK